MFIGISARLRRNPLTRAKTSNEKEVLVAMSGINTATDGLGEAIQYPTPEG